MCNNLIRIVKEKIKKVAKKNFQKVRQLLYKDLTIRYKKSIYLYLLNRLKKQKEIIQYMKNLQRNESVRRCESYDEEYETIQNDLRTKR